ncbi:sugar transferase [Nocardioides panacis]|uniref:Sugar transferase n=1 Tax=Nocardioides panacis TaxID=2849501 RepID=A0A975SYD0_9ACTN|nr:sugar transferase [Nocardioides panacis]QWZ08116.1 sugar transferase [Nocardioides panacis]
MAVSDDPRVALPRAFDRERTRGDIRLVLAITAILDVMVIVLAIILAWDLRVAFDVFATELVGADDLIVQATPWVISAWFLMLIAQGAYSARHFGAGAAEYRSVALASLFAAALVSTACYLLQVPLSRGFLLLSFLLGGPLLLVERFALRKVVHRMRRSGRLLHRVIAVGGPSGIGEVVDSLRRAQYVGYEVVGACVPEGMTVEEDRFPVPVLGTVGDTRRLCNEWGADTVLVARGGYGTSHDLRRIAWDLEGSSIDLVVVPSLTDVAGPRIHMRPVAGLPLLHLEQPQAGEAGGISKRAFDVLFAGLALLLLAPLLAVVAVLVKAQDGGPVLFRQSRVGRGGQPFGMLKFRSMVVDAEQRLGELYEQNEGDGLLFKIKADPRITPLGRFLRRYSVDEIPQLVNVLRGEMSLVGPRPPLSSEVDRYAIDVHRRLLVRPGLTGLWQVSGRSGLSWDESVRLDLYYVDNWSMTTDLVIIAKTVRAVIRSTGAY